MQDWLLGLSERIAGTSLSHIVAATGWVIPTLQTIHIVALAIVFSGGVLAALSTLGLIRVGWTPLQWHRRVWDWQWPCLIILAVSGSILIIGEPQRSLANPIFQIKMILLVAVLVVGGMNTQRLVRHQGGGGATDGAAVDMPARMLAIAALLLWCAIIAAGRWIAYFGA